jgi:REP element-mobilizing transposase RayT
MARIPRVLITGDPTAYHVISRTALDGYPIGDAEKDHFVELIRKFSALYFVEILGFCIMSNHFHLLIRMLPDTDFTDADIRKRHRRFYGKDRVLTEGQIPHYRNKWSSLSEFMREIKLGFTRFYNHRHNRRGYFWGDRFKSVVVENGDTLINCLAYIDLNPIRAGLVDRPEEYRWSSIGQHVQAGKKDNFLSLDFGLKEFGEMDDSERFRRYRRFLYEAAAIDKGKGVTIDDKIISDERKKDFNFTRTRRFLFRTRYFTDSGIIGTKDFVRSTYHRVQDKYDARREKIPKPINGLGGIYSLKRLME